MRQGSPLRIALIGHDTGMADLIRAATESRAFEIVVRFSTDDTGDSRPADANSELKTWEGLLADGAVDLVAVASQPLVPRHAALQAEQLKRLVQAGVPLILVHPVCDMLQAYELDMNRRDGKGPIFPYCPAMEHPVITSLCKAAESGSTELGTIEQITWERLSPDDQRKHPAVLLHLARDATVLRRLLGDISSVSATGPAIDSPDWGNLGIHLTGPEQRIARWSLGPRREDSGARLTLIGTQKTVSAWIPDAAGSILLSEPIEGVLDPIETRPPADEFLDRVARALDPTESWSGLAWDEVGRSLEVTDAVERSVRRQRTIDLHHEQVTERETFKSMMAAGGCGMLMWVLLLLLVAGLVEGLKLPIRNSSVWRLWPVMLLAPLSVFLGLQLLQLVFPKREHEDVP